MKLIECPRDAMQGIPQQIATKTKIDYINQLLKVGFDTIDFGSFVSPKAVPQMADTADVLQGLDLSGPSKLLAIVANMKGAEQAISHQQISYLGYPFSISETFQQRNTNKGIAESQQLVNEIMTLLDMQELVIYISMGFGNPYGDKWSPDIVEKYADQLIEMGVRTISLADTVGIAEGKTIASVFNRLSKSFPKIELGVHLHSSPSKWREKVQAAYDSGCSRFDSAVAGFGGCPFAEDELVGNIATENLISFFTEKKINITLNQSEFENSLTMAKMVFN